MVVFDGYMFCSDITDWNSPYTACFKWLQATLVIDPDLYISLSPKLASIDVYQ